MHQHVHDKIQSNGTKTRSSSKKIALSDLEVLHTETFGRSQCVSVRPSVMSTMSWPWKVMMIRTMGHVRCVKMMMRKPPKIVSLSTKSPAVRHCWLLLPRRSFLRPDLTEYDETDDGRPEKLHGITFSSQPSEVRIFIGSLSRMKRRILCSLWLIVRTGFKVGIIDSGQIYSSYHKLTRPIVFSNRPLTKIYLCNYRYFQAVSWIQEVFPITWIYHTSNFKETVINASS